MNKIFKVIFNKTTGQFVVVSELSKAKGKASSSTDERVGVSSLVTKLQHQAKAALILGLLGVSSVAYAAEPTYGDSSGTGNSIAIGNGSNASGEANIALGELSSATDISKAKKQMIAIGGKASVTGSQAIAIGGDTAASGFGSIAIGGDDADGLTEYKELRYNPTSGKVETRKSNESAYQKTTASGVGSISIGPKSQSLQNGTVAVGVLATAAGTESVSIGVKSASKGESSVALGAGSTASANNSVAIGNKAVAESDGGVALGKDSIANIAAGSKGYDVSTNAETTETNSTWKATHAAVSVGKADGTVTRQIKGVAAGSNDTDAVNVAQLKKVTLKVSGDSGSGSVALNSQTLNIDGQDGIVSEATGQKVIVKLDSTTKGKIDNALSKTEAGNTYLKKTDASTTYATKTELNGKAAGTNTFKFKIQDGAATATDAKTWTLSTSDTVTFKAGDNLDVSAANGVITYSLDNATKTSINSIASKVNTSDFNTYKTEVTTALSGKADTGLSNITDAGNTVIKNQAKQAINVVGANSRVTVNKDTTVASGVDTYKVSVDVSDLATKTEVGAKLDSSAFTKDNVTNKVNTGTVRSTTLDISGTGKVVGSDLTVNLKNGAIDTAHLSTAVQNSITNAKTKVAVNPASGGILKLDTSTDTTQPTTYTLSINETKLKDVTGTTNLATEYAKADASNINGNNLVNWKAKLNEGANLSNPTGALVKDSDLTSAALTGRISKGNVVSGSTGLLSVAGGEGKVFGSDVTISLTQDATNKINNALSESKAAETYARKDATGLSEDNKTAWKTALGVSNLDLNYKAGNESTAKTTTLSQGLHFKGEGLTITTAASGVVNFAIADNAITKAKLADNAVGTAEIEAKAVTKAKLADDVTNEIADKADKRLSNLEDAGKAVVTGLVAATGEDGITVDAKVDDTSKVKTFTVGLDDTTKGKIAKIAAGEVATSDENTVTGAKVHTAITSAKTKVKLADGSSTSLTLNKVESTDLTANEYTLKLDKEALKTELGVANLDLYYQGNANDTKQNTTLSNGLKFTSDDLTVTAKTGGEVNFTLKNDAVETANIKDSAVTKAKLAEEVKTEIANAKTVVSLDTSGSNALELTPSTTTGPTTYTLKLNETKLNQSAKLSYKANGDATAATAKEIALSTGLNFNSASTDALTIGTEADGKVNFTINTGAFADTGLAAKNGDSNKLATVGGVAGAISAVNTALTTSINTKANKDLNDISNAGKEVITGLTEVVKDTDTARLGTTTNLAEVTKVVDNANKTETFHVLVKESAVKTALNDDFAAKDATNLGDTDVSAWKTKLGVSDLTATKLKYKGNDNVATKETSLATGLTFASEDLTITAGDNGALNFALKAGAVDESNLESTLATKINNKVDNTRKLTFNTQNSADATKTSAGEWTLSSDDNVNFKAGDGLKVSGTGKEITYDLSDAHKTTLARVGAGSVADNDNNTVTGNTVFDAIEAAKTSLTTGGMTFAGDVQNNKTSKVSLGSTLTVEGEGTEPTTTAANNIAVEADGSNKLTVKLAENLSNIKTIHLKGQNGKDGKIGVDANGDVTVTNGIDGTNGTGGEASKIVTEKTIGNQTIAYKANEGTTDADKEKTVALGKGFTFKGDTNIKASIGAEGLVTYSLNPVLTGITSIAGSGTTATFGTDGIALNSKKITGLTNGATTSSSNEAVTGAQLYGVANNVKGILGSSIAIDTNGGLTATNIGNSGKNNVHEAIAASREEVAITGDVLTLAPSTTTDGANKYILGINATKLNDTAILKYKANGDGTAAAPKETALSTGLEFVSQDTDQLAITTENSGKVKFDLLTGAINVDTATKTISVVAADNNKLTTAKNVADAINAAKSSLTTSGFDVSATAAETTGNDNKVTHQLTKELAIVGKDSNLATTVAQDGNGKTTVKVGLNSTLTNMSSIGFGADAPVLSSTGLDMNGKAITDLASGLGSKDIAAADGSANALTADDKKNAVNVGDLQSVYTKLKGNTDNLANTSLTFRGDETGDDKKVDRKLGETLTLKGGADTTDSKLTSGNIAVVKDTATGANGLVVKLAEELTALKSAKFGSDANGATITSEGTEIVATAADGTKASATYALEGMKLVDGNNTSTTTAGGSTVTNGTTTTDTTAEGVKVSSNDKDDKSEATYGKDGLTVKGADGKDAINLTNKAGANNTATPTLEFAKGTDGKGTGAISGLQDIDPLDTDGSKATNKNYVDSRIADLDAGKPFEYFDNQGNKVVRGKDNQFYKATDIDGKVYVEGKGYVLPADKDNQNAKGVEAVKSGDVVINAMPNSEPMGLSNIRSGLGLSPITETKDNQTVETAITKEAAQTAVDSLVTQTGSRLNNAATVRDLQALAQAGVDFTGNNAAENKDVHRPLGTKLTIEGEATTANQTKAQFGESAADNIHVEAKGAENKLVVSLSKDLKNLKTVTASDSIQVGTDANGVKITPDATTTTKTEGTGADKKVTTVTAGADGTSIVQKDANDQPLKSAEYKLDGSKVDDGKGNTTEVKASGLTAKDTDSTTKVDANGMDVKSDDPNDKSAATYGKDGLTVKGNDGKDAISLTSTIAGGKTTNTLALNGKDGKDAVSITSGADGAAPAISFAKNGEGTDAKGTGSITGLKDVERNPDGTAKDKTQAANAGYVDDRLKEMNEGKPFEYFEKDPVTGEVKTETVDGKQVPVTLVRGKDGKFYKESDLKGKVFDPATNTYKNADGTPATLTEVASNNVTVQAMPSPTGKPLEMGNVGSGLGLDDSTTANATALTPEQAQTAIAGSGKDGKGGLLTKTGSSLNNVATVKDLQALAQAGLDFVGNETTTTAVHRPLGTKLVVQGETDAVNQTLTQFGATAKDNIYVDTDATNNKLVVKMTEDLKNINSLTTKPVDNPDGTKTSTKLTSTGTVVSKVDPAKLDADGKPTPVETANYGLTTELKKTDADGKVTTSTSAPTGTTLSEADKNGNKLREAEYDLDGTKVTLKDPVTGATKEISTGVDGTKVTSKDPATGVTKETTIGVDGTTVKVTDKNNPNNNKSAEYGVDGTALKAKDAQGNDISADYKVGGATVKDKDNTTEIKPDGMTVKSTDEADKSEAKYGKDGLSIVGPKGKDGKDGISLGYKPDTDANGQPTGTSTPTLAFGKGEKDPDGNDKGTGSITGLKDVERNPDGTAKDRTAAANAGYVDERLAEANATKPLEYFGTDGKKLVLGQDGKFYKPEDLEGKVYVKRKDGTEGYFNREEKDNPTAKPVDLKDKAVDPQTVTIKAMPSDASNTPIAMSNVGSGLGLKDDAESNKTALIPADAQKAIAGDNKDGKGGLLAQTGNALNNVATVKDLQAIAQAGLDFTGNNTATTVHRPLGTKLTVEGEGKWNGKDSAANNLYVEAQEADNKLVVKMNKDLTNLNSVTLGTATMTGKDNTINLTGAGAQVVEEFVKWDPVTKQPIRDKDGNLQKYTEKVDPRVKLSGIADGDISPNSTDAVNGRQVYALTNGNQVEQKKDGSTATYAKNKDGSVITEVKRDKSGNPVVDADGKEIVQPKEYKLTTYNVSEQQEFVTNSVITAVHNMNEQGIKFFHTNDGHNAEEQINQQSNTVDSSASGTYATAVGYKAVAAGDNALAMGKGATASGKNSIAIGTGNQVIANKSGAFGDPNIIRGVQIGTDSAGNPIYKGIDGSYAFGNDNVITSSNTFVLGNNVNNKRDSNGALTWMSAIPEGTVENSVYLGNNTTATAGDGSQTGSLKNWKQDGSRGSTTTAGSTGTVSSATVGNMIYGGFAGATANGLVSVGAAGDERRIQNVAAGEISSTSTDAINGSQLYNVAHRLGAKLESEGRQLRAGIAATTAMSNIPQVTLPGKSTLGAGIGTFEGQNAIAVGFSRMSDNGRVILKVSAGATSQGKYNAGAGIALQW